MRFAVLAWGSLVWDHKSLAIAADFKLDGPRLPPVRQSSYGKWFRQIARAAGIPDEVWNMDARAGAATEAEEAGAAIEDIRDALTHSEARTTTRYIRRRTTKIAAVNAARQRSRADENGGTS